MTDKRPVKVVLLDQARIAFEELNRVVDEQRAQGVKNSEEMQILKSIK